MEPNQNSIEIRPSNSLTKKDIKHCDFSWKITSVVAQPYAQLSTLDRTIPTTTVDPPKTKAYGFDEDDFDNIDDTDKRLWTLSRDDKVYGYILASKAWNNLVVLEDIAIDKNLRGLGLGRQLVAKVVDWCRELGLSGVKAETQSNNVSACHVYKRCGFEFGGYDQFMYYGIPRDREEVALFWYYIVDRKE